MTLAQNTSRGIVRQLPNTLLLPRASDAQGYARDGVQTWPILIGLLYLAVSLFQTASFAIGGPRLDEVTIVVFAYSHIAVPTLVLGIAILPTRALWLVFVSFFGCFIMAELIYMLWKSPGLWSSGLMIRGLLVNSTVGLVAGAAARWVLTEHGRGNAGFHPESAGLLAGIVMAGLGCILGGLLMWTEIHTVLHPDEIWQLEIALAERFVRLGLISAALLLAFLTLPDRRSLPEISLHILAFGLLGLLGSYGYDLVPVLDAPLLGLFLLIARPVRVSVPGVLGGIFLYIVLTGRYLDLPFHLETADFKMNVVANIMFVLMMLIAYGRGRSNRIERIQMQTLGRMSRAQELARFGYFLFDFTDGTAHFDPLAQGILKIPAVMQGTDFLARVHPDDRDAVSFASTTRSETGVSFSFRFCEEETWRGSANVHHFTGFILFEHSDGGRMLTYGIVVDVTQEHVQEEHLSQVLAELSERQGQQTQLFSMISHELRTPASILSMLADELDDGRPWAEIGVQMRAVLDQLLSILTDMRQTVRPEQNLPIRIEAFQPRALATSICDSFRSMAQMRGITIIARLGPGGDDTRWTDRVRLNQTLANLVKNAIVHSQATEIVIEYQEGPGPNSTWTVSDNGRNIPAKQRDRLFQPFARNSEAASGADGSGLGLYIAKGAVELLGGTLTYEDQPLSGALFRITLPFGKPEEGLGQSADVSGNLALPDLSSLTALVVEDSETMGGLLLARLSKEFREVKWLRDGTSGLAWISLNRPDVVISDLFMTGMNGDELARKLRERGFDRPIIGMTATEIGAEMDRFRAAGADAVITKPLRVHDLRLALAGLL